MQIWSRRGKRQTPLCNESCYTTETLHLLLYSVILHDLGEIKNPCGRGAEQPALGDPA